jgi:multicomponent Na+:H+ antiporter subunit C
MPFILSFALLLIGIYAIVAKKNIIKIIIGILVAEYSVNLFLLLLGYRWGGRAPIAGPEDIDQNGNAGIEFIRESVDPIPQALILTSIVIGLAMVAMMVAMAIRIYDRYGTFDISRIRRLRG